MIKTANHYVGRLVSALAAVLLLAATPFVAIGQEQHYGFCFSGHFMSASGGSVVDNGSFAKSAGLWTLTADGALQIGDKYLGVEDLEGTAMRPVLSDTKVTGWTVEGNSVKFGSNYLCYWWYYADGSKSYSNEWLVTPTKDGSAVSNIAVLVETVLMPATATCSIACSADETSILNIGGTREATRYKLQYDNPYYWYSSSQGESEAATDTSSIYAQYVEATPTVAVECIDAADAGYIAYSDANKKVTLQGSPDHDIRIRVTLTVAGGKMDGSVVEQTYDTVVLSSNAPIPMELDCDNVVSFDGAAAMWNHVEYSTTAVDDASWYWSSHTNVDLNSTLAFPDGVDILYFKGWHTDNSTNMTTLARRTAQPTVSGYSIAFEGTLYYTTDGTEPTAASATTSASPMAVPDGTIVRAMAKSGSRDFSCVVEATGAGALIRVVSSSAEMTEMDGNYILAAGFTSTGPIGTSANPFSGTIDGGLRTIAGLDHPLVGYAEGATIRNVIVEDVAVSSDGTEGNVGAIVAVASGDSRIYNCGVLGTSSTVNGTNYVGGIVGLLDGTSRVINCYSYATITGGTEVGGIVGYNNYASKHNSLKTMVMNCMFYGDITASGTIAPIYGGLEINNESNGRLNNYNYFLNEASFSASHNITKYNCALAAEERFLVRFEFYRHLLNSTRELAAWYATGSADNAHSKMAKWVLDKDVAPYPILKVQGRYPSVVNYDPDRTYDAEVGQSVERTSVSADTPNKGRHLGTLAVTISESNTTTGGQDKPDGAGLTTTSLTLNRTDKDFDNYNFNYDKVQLPYYNDVGKGNYTKGKVVTGWKITTVANGTEGEYTEADYDYPNYNYADRDTYAKDLYSVSGRVFAQGAYFNVPTGVTGITIEPYWGKAAFLSDAYYDVYGYNSDQLNTAPFPERYKNNYGYNIADEEQKVYTAFGNALNALTGVESPTVYDYAVVLVGNYHKGGGQELSSGIKPFTIMSADFNGDNEPDYCLIFKSAKNQAVSPIRYDFITVPATSMAHKMASSTDLAIPGNCTPKGWFEITTTGLMKFGQFEHSYGDKTLSPLVFMGGVIDQFVTNNTNAAYDQGTKTSYMLFGDNVWFKLLSNGTHMDKSRATPHRPISMVGGEYEKVYLSGYFNQNDSKCTVGGGDRNAEGYIDGGRFGEVAGASQEIIDGDVTWVINNADIASFFGGGINAARAITGNITTTIRNSRVDEFYGGPKFGNMATDKTVTTTATGCTFGKYYGAGYGGTALNRRHINGANYTQLNYNWSSTNWNDYEIPSKPSYRGKLNTSNSGIAVDYEAEFFAGSSGNVSRLYYMFASFSTAQTNEVSSSLKHCIVKENFYGGGALGRVTGTATSVLDSCEVFGNVFGAGFSAQIPTVTVRDNGWFVQAPYYNQSTGVYEQIIYPGTKDYKWKHVDVLAHGNQALDDDDNTIKTTEDISALGHVGEAVLTITGNSKVHLSVFGGGNEADTDGNTSVTLKGDTEVMGNVYGGGYLGQVGGNTNVKIEE